MMGVASAVSVVAVPMAFLLPAMRKKFGLSGMSIAGMILNVISYIIIFLANKNMVLFLAGMLLGSIGNVPLNMMFNMFIADTADYNEWKGFKRMEGTMGSLTGLSGKLGNALGGFIMGILMSLSGYVGGAATQPDSALMMIRILSSLVPMVFILGVIALLRCYTVDKQMPQIQADLKARAEAQETAG